MQGSVRQLKALSIDPGAFPLPVNRSPNIPSRRHHHHVARAQLRIIGLAAGRKNDHGPGHLAVPFHRLDSGFDPSDRLMRHDADSYRWRIVTAWHPVMNLRKSDRRDRERRFEREMESKAKRKGAKAEVSLKQVEPGKPTRRPQS